MGWFGKSLAHGNDSAADTLQAIVTDTTLPVSQKVRDDALLLLVKSATLDSNALATHALQVIWQARDGVDMAKAPKAALEALLGGPEHAMIALLLGEAYADGRFDGMPDAVDAKRYLEMAAAAGEAQAWRQLGDLESAGVVPDASAERAFADYQKGADAGEPGAINDLGVAYAQGLGTPVDQAKAFAAFKRAAELGHAPAMYDLDISYARGAGTPLTRAAPARRSRPTTPPNGFSAP